MQISFNGIFCDLLCILASYDWDSLFESNKWRFFFLNSNVATHSKIGNLNFLSWYYLDRPFCQKPCVCNSWPQTVENNSINVGQLAITIHRREKSNQRRSMTNVILPMLIINQQTELPNNLAELPTERQQPRPSYKALEKPTHTELTFT